MLIREPILELASYEDVYEIGRLSKVYVEYDLGWKYTPARIKKLIRRRTTNVLVARQDGAMAGFGIMTYSENTANLDLLAVKIEFRLQGVATKLLAWLEAVARDAGITWLYVQVRKINRGAIRFYTQAGFHRIDEVSGYYQRQEAAVIMCKALRGFVTESLPN